MAYKIVIAAVDLNENYDAVMQKALTVAEPDQVLVASVMETWNYLLVAGDLDWGAQANVAADLQQRLKSNDEEKMSALCGKYGIAESQVHLLEGKPAAEIKRLAEETNADLIVCGTHGRQGLGLILGSVSSGILHGTPCDVLAVKI